MSDIPTDPVLFNAQARVVLALTTLFHANSGQPAWAPAELLRLIRDALSMDDMGDLREWAEVLEERLADGPG